jgi:putative transposase
MVNAEGRKSNLIHPHDHYLKLAHHDAERRKAYRELFRGQAGSAVDKKIRSATNGNYVLGSACFQERISVALGRRVTKGKSGRPTRSDIAP